MFPKKLLTLLLNKFIKKSLYIFLLPIFFSCSNYYFVYNNNFEEFLEKTEIFISGDDYEILRSNFIDNSEKLGDIKYRLEISSLKETKSAIIENDLTASAIEVKYVMVYRFSDIQKNCMILEKEITNSSTYKSRAEGYAFGSDLSKEEISKQLVENNINTFFQAVKTISDTFECPDENQS
jgi:hypothetical protein